MIKKVYLAEKVFTNPENKYLVTTFEDQWLSEKDSAFHYAKYDDAILKEYVKKTFDVTKMSDYAKFDVRLDQSGRYFFIDTNSNPAFGPKELDMALSVILDLYGVSFYEILKRLLLNTVRDAAGKERLPLPAETVE
jgi:D-alanine-D-alanine ligase-like ATP-grasp enzyme